MKGSRKIITITLVLLAALSLALSCSSEKAMDGKSKETKKIMTGAEYRSNSEAIRGLSLAQAYVAVMADESKPTSRSAAPSGTYEYLFSSEDTLSTSKVREKLEAYISSPDTPQDAKKYCFALLSSLPKEEITLSIESGSKITYSYNHTTGIRTIVAVDISLKIDGKEVISIEKDEDEKWIKIDSIYYDNSQLEDMLEKADDAADAIEEFFENYEFKALDFEAFIKGEETSVNLPIMDGKEKEADIKGKVKFVFNNEGKTLSTYFNFTYIEYEDSSVEKEFALEASMVFKTPSPSIVELDIEKLIKDSLDVSVKVNGSPLWAEAFVDELV